MVAGAKAAGRGRVNPCGASLTRFGGKGGLLTRVLTRHPRTHSGNSLREESLLMSWNLSLRQGILPQARELNQTGRRDDDQPLG